MRLQGKAAIVTGGASGIGRAICLGYAREGADVAVVDIQQSKAEETCKLIRELGRNAIAIKADVTQPDQVEAMVNTVKSAFGRIDILVNGVGKQYEIPFLECTVEQFDEITNVNLRSALICAKAVAPHMMAMKSGKIINFGAVTSFRGRANQEAYCAAKHAIINLTRGLALQLGWDNINVNAIAPGIIDTDSLESLRDKPEMQAKAIARMPLGRIGTPEDIVGPAIFLASDEARYITGEILVVDGGNYQRMNGCGIDKGPDK